MEKLALVKAQTEHLFCIQIALKYVNMIWTIKCRQLLQKVRISLLFCGLLIIKYLGLKNTIVLSYLFEEETIFWSDIADDIIYKSKFNGIGELYS